MAKWSLLQELAINKQNIFKIFFTFVGDRIEQTGSEQSYFRNSVYFHRKPFKTYKSSKHTIFDCNDTVTG